MTHTLLDSRHGASRAREILGNIALTQVSSSQLHFPFAFQSPWSRRPLMCADSGLLSVRMTLGKLGKPLASRADQSKHPDEPLRLKEIQSEMEQAKLAKGSGHKPIGHSSTSAPKKATRKKAESARPLRKEIGQQVEIRETGLPLLRER